MPPKISRSKMRSISNKDLFAAVDLKGERLKSVRNAVKSGKWNRTAAAWGDYFSARKEPLNMVAPTGDKPDPQMHSGSRTRRRTRDPGVARPDVQIWKNGRLQRKLGALRHLRHPLLGVVRMPAGRFRANRRSTLRGMFRRSIQPVVRTAQQYRQPGQSPRYLLRTRPGRPHTPIYRSLFCVPCRRHPAADHPSAPVEIHSGRGPMALSSGKRRRVSERKLADVRLVGAGLRPGASSPNSKRPEIGSTSA